MPTYQYFCENCGMEIEKFQAILDDKIKICPHCNKEMLKRLPGSGAYITFKGPGFYCNDYKNKQI